MDRSIDIDYIHQEDSSIVRVPGGIVRDSCCMHANYKQTSIVFSTRTNIHVRSMLIVHYLMGRHTRPIPMHFVYVYCTCTQLQAIHTRKVGYLPHVYSFTDRAPYVWVGYIPYVQLRPHLPTLP